MARQPAQSAVGGARQSCERASIVRQAPVLPLRDVVWIQPEVVVDTRCQCYPVEGFERLPANFGKRIQETMLLNAFSVEEMQRRRGALMAMWPDMLPVVEGEPGLSYEKNIELEQ